MNISLCKVEPTDLSDYIRLEQSDLSHYTSRMRPHDYCDKAESALYWRYICLNDMRVGALWLEKDSIAATVAILGIFIADENHTSKGIGKSAIEMAITQAQEKMDLTQIDLTVRESNIRAKRCYEKCGFKEVSKFTKEVQGESINSIIMSLFLYNGE